MNSVLRSSLKVALLFNGIAALAIIGLAFTPQADAVMCGGDLVCPAGSGTTIQTTAWDADDCMWADNKAKAQLRSQAGCDNAFGFCLQNFERVGTCYFDTTVGEWVATWKLTYKCYQCWGPLIQCP